MATIRQNDKQVYHTQPIIHNKEALPGGGSPVVSSEFSEFSCRCRKLNENSLSLLEFWKWGIAMRCELKKPLQCNFSVKIPYIEHLYIAIHNSQEGPLKRTDKRRPLKCNEN